MSTDSLSLLWWWIQPAVARFFCMQYQKTLFFSYDLSSNMFLMYAVSEKPVLFLWSQFKHVSSVCRQCQKTLFCSSDLSSNTLWTLLKNELFYHAHISSHRTYENAVWNGCSDIIFKQLNSLHRRAAKLTLPDPSKATEAKILRLGLLPLVLESSLCSTRLYYY